MCESNNDGCGRLDTLADIGLPYGLCLTLTTSVLLWFRIVCTTIHYFRVPNFSIWYRNRIGQFALISFYISMVMTDISEQYFWYIGNDSIATPPTLMWSVMWLVVNVISLLQCIIAFMPKANPWVSIHDNNVICFVMCAVAIASRLAHHEIAISQVFVCTCLMCGVFLAIWDRSSIRLDTYPVNDDSFQDFLGSDEQTSTGDALEEYVSVELQPMNTKGKEKEDDPFLE